MSKQIFWPIFGVSFILAMIVIGLIASHFEGKRRLRLREIQKEERLKAIEAGTPLPEVEDPFDSEALSVSNPEAFRRRVTWFRLVSMAVGLVLVCGGLGFVIGLGASPNVSLHQVATVGFVPTLAGVGLILFWWLSRRLDP